MRRILVYYNFIVCGVMVLVGFSGAQSYPQLASAALFYPLAVYFTLLVIPQRKRALKYPVAPVTKPTKKGVKLSKIEPEVLAPEEETERDFDLDRRAFIKLIGSAGLSVFFLSMFTKKAQAAFFGSVPGPGTIAIKDSTGTVIDPAEKHPTDGYRLAELDDAVPSYYGFINKDSEWFIMREEASGTYKYKVGTTGFTTAWSGRATIPEIEWLYYDSAF